MSEVQETEIYHGYVPFWVSSLHLDLNDLTFYMLVDDKQQRSFVVNSSWQCAYDVFSFGEFISVKRFISGEDDAIIILDSRLPKRNEIFSFKGIYNNIELINQIYRFF